MMIGDYGIHFVYNTVQNNMNIPDIYLYMYETTNKDLKENKGELNDKQLHKRL